MPTLPDFAVGTLGEEANALDVGAATKEPTTNKKAIRRPCTISLSAQATEWVMVAA